MKETTYSELLSNSLGRLIWLFIAIPGVHLFMSFIYSIIIEIKFEFVFVEQAQHYYYFLKSISTSVALGLVQLILWVFIKKLINKNNGKVEFFIHILFKVMMLTFLFTFIHSLLNLPYITVAEITKHGKMDVRSIFVNTIVLSSKLVMFVFVYLIARNYKELIGYQTRKLFNVLSFLFLLFYIIALGFSMVLLIEKLIGIITSNVYDVDQYYRYLTLSDITENIFTYSTGFVWFFFFIKFLKSYKSVSFNENSDAMHMIRINNNVVINSLKKKYLLVIGTSVLITHFLFMTYIISLRYGRSNRSYSLLTLYRHGNDNYILIIIIGEILLFSWLIKIIFFKSKTSPIMPIMTFLFLNIFLFIRTLPMLAYLDTRLYIINTILVPLLTSIGIILFLSIIVMNFGKQTRSDTVTFISFGLVGIMLIKLLLSIHGLFNKEFLPVVTSMGVRLSTSQLEVGWFSLVISMTISLASFTFWGGFALSYKSEYSKALVLKKEHTYD
ncbi:hypothetical protein [Haloplasma contractile]|uniref:Uncharacterized protein n=1 Tax=Haloplasma contractile SSD-17B TaxID=1033810 RepID=F7Q1W4_9MOLU|nr:hypothetical protein [Haloplasma contractile]ERJ12225.1 hypothetical protein HLPCO_001752 [Haloplasma contractile SSD-17B]